MGHFVDHLFAFLRTALTGVRALLAMIGFVFSAFCGTPTANLRAMFADMRSLLGPPGNQRSHKAADVCAITVQRNAARHHFYVVLVQTGRRTVLACRGADVASLNAGFVFLMYHMFYSSHDSAPPHRAFNRANP